MNKIHTNYTSNPFKVIFDGFANMFKYNQNLSIILLVAYFLTQGSYIFSNSTFQSLKVSPPTNEQLAIIVTVFLIIFILMIPLMIFFSTMLYGISAFTALKTSQQQTATFKQAWDATIHKFWTILGITIVVGLKVLGGFLLFIIPGVRAGLRYNMVYMFVFDHNLGVRDSISKSKELTKDHLIEVLGMTFASGVIPFVSSIMAVGGQSIMYKQLTDLKSTPHEKPAVHWLNYLIFIVFGTLFMFIFAIVLLVIAL